MLKCESFDSTRFDSFRDVRWHWSAHRGRKDEESSALRGLRAVLKTSHLRCMQGKICHKPPATFKSVSVSKSFCRKSLKRKSPPSLNAENISSSFSSGSFYFKPNFAPMVIQHIYKYHINQDIETSHRIKHTCTHTHGSAHE